MVGAENASLGFPEVTLPVIPGMEGCRWTFRKVNSANYLNILNLLLTGKFVKAKGSVGWLTDFAGTMDASIKMAWDFASGGNHDLKKRELNEGIITDVPKELAGLDIEDISLVEARKVILAKHSGSFMSSKLCKKGVIGTAYVKTWLV
jgi:hypothetical protein